MLLFTFNKMSCGSMGLGTVPELPPAPNEHGLTLCGPFKNACLFVNFCFISCHTSLCITAYSKLMVIVFIGQFTM